MILTCPAGRRLWRPVTFDSCITRSEDAKMRVPRWASDETTAMAKKSVRRPRAQGVPHRGRARRGMPLVQARRSAAALSTFLMNPKLAGIGRLLLRDPIARVAATKNPRLFFRRHGAALPGGRVRSHKPRRKEVYFHVCCDFIDCTICIVLDDEGWWLIIDPWDEPDD
jgi:hypothetical protein